MFPNRSILLVVLVLFVLLTVYVGAVEGVEGLIAFLSLNGWAVQVSADLVIGLGLVLVWIYGDTRRRGKAFWPWLTATLLTGSIGPLLYFVLRPGAPKPS